jgi:hypothetical protein
MRVLLPTAVSFLLLLAACREDSVSAVDVRVAVESEAVDFGPVWVGAAAERRVEVRNDGRVPVSLEIHGLALPFEGPSRVDLSVGQTVLVPFRFRPTAPGEARTTVTFHGPVEEPIALTLSGIGTEATLVAPSSLDFGGIPVGETTVRSLSLRNDGLLPVSNLRYEFRGGDAAAFAVTGPVEELAPAAEGELEISLEAGALEDYRTVLVITPCTACNETKVELTGRGAETRLEAEPARLDFPAVPPGGSSHLVLRVANRGGLPAALDQLRLTGAGFAAGSVALPAVLGEDEGIEVPLSFVPPEPGDYVGTVALLDPDGEPAVEVPLQGHCGGPILAADPPAVDFGRVPLGARRAVRMVIRNVGEEWPVELGTANIEGGPGWSVSMPPLPLPIEGPGLPIEVGFSGVGVGPAEATLILAASDPAWDRLHVPLRAEVPNDSCQLEVFPSPLRFGSELGIDQERTIELANMGPDSCILWDVRLDPASNPGFEFRRDFEVSAARSEGVDLRSGEALWIPVIYSKLSGSTSSDHLLTGTIHYRTSNVEAPAGQIELTAWPRNLVNGSTPPFAITSPMGEAWRGSVATWRMGGGGGAGGTIFRILAVRLAPGSDPAIRIASVVPLPHQFSVPPEPFYIDLGIEIEYAPTDPGPHLGVLELEMEALVGSPAETIPYPEPIFIEIQGTVTEP